MSSSSQKEWIRSALAQYEGPLTRYAVHITGDIERARDVVQDTFLRLCSQKRSWVDDHLAQWLFTVCRNRALDVRRKENRMSATKESQFEAQATQEPEPTTVLEKKEELSRVLRILETLPPNQQEVIRLKFQNALSYREISDVTHLSISNVGLSAPHGIKDRPPKTGRLVAFEFHTHKEDQMSIDPKDPRLTAYALGELESEDERIEIEKALENSEELTRMVAQIRQTAALVSEELPREPSPGLAPKHRQRIERELRGPVGFFSSSLGKWALGGAAAAAACWIFAMIMIPNLLQSKSDGNSVAQLHRQEISALSLPSSPSDERVAEDADPNTEFGNRRYEAVVSEPAGAPVRNEDSEEAVQEEVPAAVYKLREAEPESQPCTQWPCCGDCGRRGQGVCPGGSESIRHTSSFRAGCRLLFGQFIEATGERSGGSSGGGRRQAARYSCARFQHRGLRPN